MASKLTNSTLMLFFSVNAFATSALAGTPVSFDRHQAIPTIPCTIGTSLGNCILDSGANVSFVSITPASSKLPVIGTATATFEGSASSVNVVTADLFSIGPEINGNSMLVVRTDNYDGLPNYQGVVGADLLKKAESLIFDFSKKFNSQMQIYSQGQQNGDMMKVFTSFGKIISGPKVEFEVLVNGVKAHAMWDTHSMTGFSKNFVSKNPSMFVTGDSQTFWDVNGSPVTVLSHQLNGEVCFSQSCTTLDGFAADAVMTDDSPIDLIIGYEMINQMTWYFNFKTGMYAVFIPTQE